jgi:hypothetical protein
MTRVHADDVASAAARVFDGDAQLRFAGPDGVEYLVHRRPDLFAGEPRTIGDAPYVRRTLVTRRADGAAMKGQWGSTVATSERDVFRVEQLRSEMEASLEAGTALDVLPFHGPHRPTDQDRIHAWNEHTAAFRSSYGAAWASGDRQGLRTACAAFHRDFPRWAISGSDHDAALHDSAATISRNVRGEPHPPRFHIAGRYRHGHRRRGFAAHAERERDTLGMLARLRSLPGYDPEDGRDVVPVTVSRIGSPRHVRRAELHDPTRRHLSPVRPDGTPMPRAASVDRDRIEAIRPARRTPSR